MKTKDRMIDSSSTVNEILVQYPSSVYAFNAFGIDTCCGGSATIEEAAKQDGLNPESLLAALAWVSSLDKEDR